MVRESKNSLMNTVPIQQSLNNFYSEKLPLNEILHGISIYKTYVLGITVHPLFIPPHCKSSSTSLSIFFASLGKQFFFTLLI